MVSQSGHEARSARIAALLEDNVLTELSAELAMHDIDLPQALVRQLAGGIAAEILYAFDVNWRPDWVKPGEVHSWRDGDRWLARCGKCLRDSPAAASEFEASSWARQHETSHGDTTS
jgi:hypothetical protein